MIGQFVAHVRRQCADYGVRVQLDLVEQVKDSTGDLSEGYFCDTHMLLHVAQQGEWVEVLAHEFCHFLQWREQCPEWMIMESHPITEKYGRDSVQNIFNDWISGTLDLPEQEVRVACSIVRDLERDCEERTVKIFKEFNLPVDEFRYARKANAYIHLYNVMRLTRSWYKEGKEPYRNEQLLSKMADVVIADASVDETMLYELAELYE